MDCSNIDFGYATEISINSVDISYWDTPGDTEITVVQPVYIFSGTAKDTAGNRSNVYITVQANRVSQQITNDMTAYTFFDTISIEQMHETRKPPITLAYSPPSH